MAKKISNILKEYGKKVAEIGVKIEIKPQMVPRKAITRFMKLVAINVDDPRSQNMTRYSLGQILTMAFFAVLGGELTFIDMEDFCKENRKFLKKVLLLPDERTPCHDTFSRVFSAIKMEQLEKVTVAVVMERLGFLRKALKIDDGGMRHLSVDGKVMRGSGRKRGTDEEVPDAQALHIFSNTEGVCIATELIGEKTNEIPVAQRLLGTLDLRNTLVSFDALHTQQQTIAVIREGKGHYVGALKGNQQFLEQEATLFFSEKDKQRMQNKPTEYYETIEKAHNQVEKRSFYLAKVNTKKNNVFVDWAGLKGIICYQKNMYNVVSGKETTETRYYITSLSDVVVCAEGVRGHWGVENRLHWHLDVLLGEDANMTTDRVALGNLGLIKKMVLSLYKLLQPMLKEISIRRIRKKFGRGDFKSELAMLLSLDEKTIREALEKATEKK
ncbi:MAG: ISAs1 family transposase [Thermoplasmata archaeon]|nr:ISAs1 family transposase [Thermoplasmata archaeon]